MRRALAGVIVAAAAGAVHPAHANRPDSVFIFSYANPNGDGGLKLAWSADGVKWQKLNRGNSFVNSDFGSWGDMKKMFEPKLMQRPSDGMWVATWKLAEGGGGDGCCRIARPYGMGCAGLHRYSRKSGIFR